MRPFQRLSMSRVRQADVHVRVLRGLLGHKYKQRLIDYLFIRRRVRSIALLLIRMVCRRDVSADLSHVVMKTWPTETLYVHIGVDIGDSAQTIISFG